MNNPNYLSIINVSNENVNKDQGFLF
jgi:hypothetical protein